MPIRRHFTAAHRVAASCPLAAAEEVTARIAQLQAARRLLNIQKAMAALHADDDFQGDIAQVGCRSGCAKRLVVRMWAAQLARLPSKPWSLAHQ